MCVNYKKTYTFLDHVTDEVRFCDLYETISLITTFKQPKQYETLIIVTSKIKKPAKLNMFLFTKLVCGQPANSANSSFMSINSFCQNHQPVIWKDSTLVLVDCLGSTFHVSFTKRWNGTALYALATQSFSFQETHLFCKCIIQMRRTQFMDQQLK